MGLNPYMCLSGFWNTFAAKYKVKPMSYRHERHTLLFAALKFSRFRQASIKLTLIIFSHHSI